SEAYIPEAVISFIACRIRVVEFLSVPFLVPLTVLHIMCGALYIDAVAQRHAGFGVRRDLMLARDLRLRLAPVHFGDDLELELFW
ncbi:MAG: hypothetical protein ACRD9R_22340, partial [Pyrinomonadaceae bacterium]